MPALAAFACTTVPNGLTYQQYSEIAVWASKCKSASRAGVVIAPELCPHTTTACSSRLMIGSSCIEGIAGSRFWFKELKHDGCAVGFGDVTKTNVR